jgi:hypothetical protein
MGGSDPFFPTSNIIGFKLGLKSCFNSHSRLDKNKKQNAKIKSRLKAAPTEA